jgi:hypothetical protein
MRSTRDSFKCVQVDPNSLQLLGLQSISALQDLPEFIPTAEVIAEVNPLREVQRVA